ncbi:MAG TPA: hypothetical protein VHP33_41355 [Polyangiaceae bacterium]|nr:hypothetical protein [Polyangiaceae bacterium]
MQNASRSEYVTRDRILKLLSDQEVASVATAETADRLADGDEYLDLERLHEGVQRAGSAATPMGRVLPKKAIHDSTWDKLLEQLATTPS